MDNLCKQVEEIEALSSIYGDEWVQDSPTSQSYRIRIKEKNIEAVLYVTLPLDYPSESPPEYELSAPMMDRKEKLNLHAILDSVYLENIGETVLFQWIEKIRETLQTVKSDTERATERKKQKEHEIDLRSLVISETSNVPCPKIITSEVIVDRKSSFQGHAAVVKSIEEVNVVLATLKLNKKILHATHNMYAYRIERESGKGTSILQDCDDDGENHAGGRMLHLLQILDQKNSLVVVSRWYGGIQLGPDRFRHINNATRQVLQQAGLLKD